MVIPINDETIAEVPNTSCCEERHKANEKFHGFVCECPCHQSKPCCERPRKTVSVSTLKGRRAICNNCGADWPQSSHSKGEAYLAGLKVLADKKLREAYQGHPDEMSWEEEFDALFTRAITSLGNNSPASEYLAAAVKDFFSKLLSDRERGMAGQVKLANKVIGALCILDGTPYPKLDDVNNSVDFAARLKEKWMAAGAEAERERILQLLPRVARSQDETIDTYLQKLSSLLTPNPTTE